MAIVITLLGLGVAMSLLAPALALLAPDPGRRRAARRHLAYAGFVVLVCAAPQIGITFAPHALNVAAVLAALLAGAALALFAVTAAPGPIDILAGLLCTAAWLAALLGTGLIALVRDHSPVTVSLGDGIVCRESVYGMAATASGMEYDFDRRYGFIDRRLYRYEASDDRSENMEPAEARWQQPLARCQALASAARTGAAE